MENPERHTTQIFEGGVDLPGFDWDFPQYRTPREYIGKDVKPGLQKATKKGFYMDYLLKTSKEIPSARIFLIN